ncbi:MAG: enoyl-CoA hydratase/isomerase family protein, partial [Thermodesulfobacteriota bacterium]
AQEAVDMGLANKVVPAEQLETEAQAWATRFSKLSGVVLRLARKAVTEGWDTRVDEGLGRIEEIYLRELMATGDAKEGLHAFLEKREPLWK